MGELVNLNHARKSRARADAQARAAENRAAHGRSKPDRLAAKAELQARERVLDGAMIVHAPTPGPEQDG